MPHPSVVPARLHVPAAPADGFFERRSRRTIRTSGSPNTPRTVALARKPANEYPSDRRRCRFPDLAMPQHAKIQPRKNCKKGPIHKRFRRHDPSKSPTRFPEDPENHALELIGKFRRFEICSVSTTTGINRSIFLSGADGSTSFSFKKDRHEATHQVSRMVGSWNAVKSLWASGCMNAVKVAIPSLSSDKSWIECAFHRPSAPRV